jgi:hypothetical protein
MFKTLVEKLKKWLVVSVPKQSNPVAAKVQQEVINDLLEKAEVIAEIADETAKDIEKEIVEAVKEVKKKGRPAKSGAAPSKKKPSTKKSSGGGNNDSQVV